MMTPMVATRVAADLIRECLDGSTEQQIADSIRAHVTNSNDMELLLLTMTGLTAALAGELAGAPELLERIALRCEIESIYDGSETPR